MAASDSRERSATFTIGEETLELGKGQIAVVPADTPHKFVSGDGFRLISITPAEAETLRASDASGALIDEVPAVPASPYTARRPDATGAATRGTQLRFEAAVGGGIVKAMVLPKNAAMLPSLIRFSMSGLIAFIPTCAIVMFIYLTAAVGFYGRTVGMRMFSLELVDVDENEYPSLHQAAVNSAVYLLSMAFAGAGFTGASPRYLLEMPRRFPDAVIALGGGTVLSPANRARLTLDPTCSIEQHLLVHPPVFVLCHRSSLSDLAIPDALRSMRLPLGTRGEYLEVSVAHL